MLQINDIFESISGEAGGFPQGTWTTFIRLQGCNLLCRYCDTLQAQDSGVRVAANQAGGVSKQIYYEMDIPAILKMTRNKHVLVTGGEPLLQNQTPELIKALQKNGHVVQVETNGSLELPRVPDVYWVIDRKCPSSGMSGMMLPIQELSELMEQAQADDGSVVYLKWVVSNNDDVDFMIYEMNELIGLGNTMPFIVSPVDADGSKIQSIVERIWESDHKLLDYIIFSVQLHKLVNMP